jgi:heme exporter protein C
MHKKIVLVWSIVAAAFIAVDSYLIAFYAPVEINQGVAQKIFYWHVPSAMIMMLFYVIGGIASVAYLAGKKLRADALAVSFIEVGFLFCTIVLFTGPLWAKPVWGAWWTWDPRLTSTLFVWVVFFGYFMLRANLENKDHARTYGAVLALFGCLDIPIIVLAVKLWRGVHPQVLSARENLPNEMWTTLITSAVTVATLASLLVFLRYKKEMRQSSPPAA